MGRVSPDTGEGVFFIFFTYLRVVSEVTVSGQWGGCLGSMAGLSRDRSKMNISNKSPLADEKVGLTVK